MSELVLHRLSGDAGFELCTEVSPFSFAHLVLFRVGRPQKTGLFINKALAPFPRTTSQCGGPLLRNWLLQISFHTTWRDVSLW
jgi:hypothetical protein